MPTANPLLLDPIRKVVSYELLGGGGEEQIDVASEQMLVHLGPRHPANRGVLHMALRLDGEIVLEAVPQLGYLYRGDEKIAQSQPYSQNVSGTDRLDYLSTMNNNHAWAMAVEKLADIQVPLRAEYIRVIAAELNRIASHLVSLAAFGTEMGKLAPFFSALRQREFILDLFQRLCGTPEASSYITVGGVAEDLPPGFLQRLAEFLDYFEPVIDEFIELLSSNPIFIKRTANIGVVSKSLAIGHALSGPMIRGSGIALDLRKDRPYSIYDRLDFEVCVGSGLAGRAGDCWDRYWVRVQEMRQSVNMIRQCIAQMPAGAFRAQLPPEISVDAGEVYEEYENPRGHLGFFIQSQGGAIPFRVKIRGPSFVNLAVAGELCRNVLLRDVAVIIGSIDVVMSEVDR